MNSLKTLKSLKPVLLAILPVCLLCTEARGLEVYLVRHAETMGNVTGNYSEENQCTFSPRGLQQIRDLPAKIGDLRFDHILVSPAWRTQQTILPYLQATGQRGELCPEVEEADCGIRGDELPAGEPPRGPPMQIVPEGAACFFVPEVASARHYAPRHRADGLTIMKRGADLIRTRFGGKDQRILVVTHSCTGSRLMELLLGLPAQGTMGPGNAALSHLVEKGDGRFELLVFNDEPLTPLRRISFMGFDQNALPGFLNLAGEWRIAAGDDPAWAGQEADESGFKSITVPGGWERSALPDYDGIAWYRLEFDLPPNQREMWGDAPLVLLMGAIDDADETFLNGAMIGASGRFSPEEVTAWDQMRMYPIEVSALGQQNVLAVRVDDWGGGGGIWRGPVAIGPARVVRETTNSH
ncbi:MAG: histidine phosphatase family protein [Kiritimatiellae bacterium]|nr:histidine phosphatase family protein [Kiritimatiellia bacterium]